jgi:hypothetical protein
MLLCPLGDVGEREKERRGSKEKGEGDSTQGEDF